ncbi:MAG TPA: ATP-binding protein [Terriglobia bacterium]|nr:ATP-binding protein [Terriglobia bacterium]
MGSPKLLHSAPKRPRLPAEKEHSTTDALFRALSENAPVGITLARGGRTLYANRAYLQLFGYADPSAVLGQSLLNQIAPECREKIADHVRRRERGEAVPNSYETVGLRQDGTTFPFRVDVARIQLEDGAANLAFFTDVAEHRNAERKLSQALARERAARTEAETANRMKDEFLATLSHELRTPLTAVLGWARLLRSGELDADTAARAVETIESNARLQAQLIEDLLDVSRIILGKLPLGVRPVELALVTEAALDAVRPAAAAKSIRLSRVLDPATGLVSGDPDRLQQVVWNLLSNAVKFTSSKGQVEIKLERVGRFAQITVSDTGKGISAEFLPFVFDRFRQADSSSTRLHGGLGLGLALVRHLVELHGGSVHAASAGEGEGATFSVQLPLLSNEDIPDSLTLRSAHGTGRFESIGDVHVFGLRGVSVLVMSDESAERDLLKAVLERQGALVTAAYSTAEAVALVLRKRPDVFVADFEMAGPNSARLLEALAGTGMGTKIPTLAIVNAAPTNPVDKALLALFRNHLTRPLDPTRLTESVRVLTNGRRKRRKTPST